MGRIQKIVCSRNRRTGAAVLGVMLLAGGAAGGWFVARPQQEKQETVNYTCRGDAGADYRVHLRPNELYEEEWLEAGRVYAEKLTDYIEIILHAELVGSGEGEISGGRYLVAAVLEGYQGGTESGKKQIYEKRFPMIKGAADRSGMHHAEVEETLQIRTEDYRHYMEQAEATLGGSTAKDLYLLFEGMFVIRAGEEEKEVPYSCRFMLPTGSGTPFYEIAGAELSSLESKMTGTVTVPGRWNPASMVPVAGAGGMGLLLLLFVGLWTRLPNEWEAWRIRMAGTLRKYGSRMVRVEALPSLSEKELCYLGNIESLIIMAEEIRQPVLYCLDKLGLPEEGLFCVPDGRRMYLLRSPAPSTPKGVEELDEGSRKE